MMSGPNDHTDTHQALLSQRLVVGGVLVPQRGLEPLTLCLEGTCSIRLSYWGRTSRRPYLPLTIGRKPRRTVRPASTRSTCSGKCPTIGAGLRGVNGWFALLKKARKIASIRVGA